MKTAPWRAWKRNISVTGDDFDYVDTRTFLARGGQRAAGICDRRLRSTPQEIDWKLLAAISYQESHWDAQATSPTGVRGLMMLTQKYRPEPRHQRPDRCGTEHQRRRAVFTGYDGESAGDGPGRGSVSGLRWPPIAWVMRTCSTRRALTAKTKGNPDSWSDVKQRLPLLSQKQWYQKLTYGYARGHEAYAYVENIRKYQISLVGYLLEKEKEAAEAQQLAESYPVVAPDELNHPAVSILPFVAFSAADAFEKSHLTDPNILVQVPRR